MLIVTLERVPQGMNRKKITIQDIANQAGVSKTTVSRYLNGKFDFMSPATKDTIANVISETGYRPNRMANGLKTKHSGLIGFVMSNAMSSQVPRLLASVCDTCAQHGMKIIVVNSEKKPDKEKALVYELLDQRVDGLLVVSGYNGDFYQKLDEDELPVVLADRVPSNSNMDSVAINHEASTHQLINYLLNQGFKQFIVIKRMHTNPNNTPALRVKAATKTCEEYFGDKTHCQTVVVEYSSMESDNTKGLQDITSILTEAYHQSSKTPTAVFVAEATMMNLVACGYYRAGLKISKNFVIAGYSEKDMGGMMITPAIPTIEQPLEHMGQLATERLIRRIEQRSLSKDEVREKTLLSCKVTFAPIK